MQKRDNDYIAKQLNQFQLPDNLSASSFTLPSLLPELFLDPFILPPTPAGLPAFCPSGVAFPEDRPACRRPNGGG